MLQQEMSKLLPATQEAIEKTSLSQVEWDRVNAREPEVVGVTADKLQSIQAELASYLDMTPEQALLILVETVFQRRA